MYKVFVSRLIGILILVPLKLNLNSKHFLLLISSLALSHYLVSFYFSWKATKNVFKYNPLLTLFIILLGIGMATSSVPSIVIFFGIHHVLSEHYLGREKNHSLAFDSSRILLILLSYLFFVKRNVMQVQMPFLMWLFVILGAGYLLYCIFLTYKKELTRYFMANEILSFALVCVFVLSPTFGFVEIVGYHFLVWLFIPCFQSKDSLVLIKYLVSTIVSFLFLLVVAVYIYQNNSLNGLVHVTGLFFNAMFALGYIHIALSFIVSRQNPRFLLRISGQLEKKD